MAAQKIFKSRQNTIRGSPHRHLWETQITRGLVAKTADQCLYAPLFYSNIKASGFGSVPVCKYTPQDLLLGLLTHTHTHTGEEKERLRGESEACVHGILKEKFEKSLSLGETLAVSRWQRREREVNEARRGRRMAITADGGRKTRRRRRGEPTYSGAASRSHHAALLSAPLSACGMMCVSVCVGCGQSSAAVVCSLCPALLHLY